jgi:hypothetical protein
MMSGEKSLINFLDGLIKVEANPSQIMDAGDDFDQLIEEDLRKAELNGKEKETLLKYLNCLIQHHSALTYSLLNDDKKFNLILDFVVEAVVNKGATWSEIMPPLSGMNIEKQLKIDQLLLQKRKENLEGQLRQLEVERQKEISIKKQELARIKANYQYVVITDLQDIRVFRDDDKDAKEGLTHSYVKLTEGEHLSQIEKIKSDFNNKMEIKKEEVGRSGGMEPLSKEVLILKFSSDNKLIAVSEIKFEASTTAYKEKDEEGVEEYLTKLDLRDNADQPKKLYRKEPDKNVDKLKNEIKALEEQKGETDHPLIKAMNSLEKEINSLENKKKELFTFKPELLKEKAEVLRYLKDRFEVIERRSKIDKNYSPIQAEQDIHSYLTLWESAYKKVIEKHRVPLLLRIFSKEKKTNTQKVVESLKKSLPGSNNP